MEQKEQYKNNFNNFVDSPFVKWISIIIGLAGFFGFCYDHFVENNPKLTFTIVKEASLLNDEANIPSLQIVLDSINLRNAKSNISIYTIKIANEGKQHITKNMYDENIGLSIKQGRYIGTPILSYASSPHISSYFTNKTITSNEHILIFPNISMDKGDAYLLDVIIIHSIDTVPNFKIHGKITGQKEIIFTREITNKASFWNITFGGGIWVNIIRIVVYFIFGVAVIVIIFLLVEKITSAYHKVKLQKSIQKITSRHRVNQQIIDDFNELEMYDLILMHQWLTINNEDATKKYIQLQKKCKSKTNSIKVYRYKQELDIVKQMIHKGYLNQSNENVLSINDAMKNDFIYVYKRLKKQKQFSL